jgi:hypothetical protein
MSDIKEKVGSSMPMELQRCKGDGPLRRVK